MSLVFISQSRPGFSARSTPSEISCTILPRDTPSSLLASFVVILPPSRADAPTGAGNWPSVAIFVGIVIMVFTIAILVP